MNNQKVYRPKGTASKSVHCIHGDYEISHLVLLGSSLQLDPNLGAENREYFISPPNHHTEHLLRKKSNVIVRDGRGQKGDDRPSPQGVQ